VDPKAIMAHFAGVSSLVVTIWFLVRRDVPATLVLDRTTMLLLLGVGVTGTIGQYFLTKAYAAGPPGEVAVIGLTQVLFAMGFDVLLWSRSMPIETIAGFFLVLAPTAFITAQMRKRISTAEPSPADLTDPEAL
jgi:drug/metabolite transporter (DMT)-like permease